jgi:uncharacterized membrane protein
MKIPKFLFVLFVCTLIAATAMAQDVPTLTIKCADVKSVKGALETDSYAINNKAVIAGDYVDSAGIQHGMILNKKVVTTFDGPPGSSGTAAYGINTASAVVGWYLNSSGVANGFMYANGTMTAVAYPGAASTQANGINDNGYIVGSYVDTAGATHGFYWDTKKYHAVNIPGATTTIAWAINNANVMTAYNVDPTSGLPVDAYTYDGTNFTKFDPPGSIGSAIHGISNKGDLNYTIFDSSNNRHGVVYQAKTKTYTQFDDPKGINSTRADGINDKLMQVGRYSPTSGVPPNAGFKCTAK